MYGVLTSVNKAPEGDFSEAMEHLEELGMAIESLSVIVASKNISAQKLTEYSECMKKIAKHFKSTDLGLEAYVVDIANESVDDALKVAGIIGNKAKSMLQKIVAYARKIMEHAYHTVNSMKRTASSLVAKSTKIIGIADTPNPHGVRAELTDAQKRYVITKVGINGSIPNKLAEIINAEVKISDKLASVRYDETLQEILNDILKGEEVSNVKAASLIADIKRSCGSVFNKEGGQGTVFVSNVLPGNICLRVSILNDESMSGYSCNIETVPTSGGDGECYPMELAEIIKVAREIKVFAHRIVKDHDIEKNLEKTTRTLRYLERSKDPRTAGIAVSDFARLIKNPYTQHARAVLTSCSRVIKFCEMSLNGLK